MLMCYSRRRTADGKAALLIDLARRGHWNGMTSAFALEEARRNLERKYPDRLEALDRLLGALSIVAASGPGPCALALPEKDQPIFAAALQSGATHLLTGDMRHFGRFMNDPGRTEGIVIQPVAEFLDGPAVPIALANDAKSFD
ncbi:MAG: DNA-binding protein [Thiohalocapsa sp. PB-PSB1]|nr:MAG: DNA-binding protein [Thiohalocapsa sp. PB-PSB1]